MRDVARDAAVSIKTVSRVVNNQGEISDETRQRVLEAIERLGYRPSKLARALVTQRSDTIGLILGDITNPFFSEVARSVLATAQAQGYHVFLANSDYDPAQEMRTLFSLADHDVDGIIIFPCCENRDKLLAFAEQHMPLVVVNRNLAPHPRIGLVLSDIRGGARLAVDYLVGKGHTEIGMLVGRATPLHMMERVQGFREALHTHGLAVEDGQIATGTSVLDMERGYEAARQLLSARQHVTALLAYNDLIALGALQACRDLGLQVPDDVAIVGFDNISFAEMVSPALTTVHINKHELGQQAIMRLVEMLEDPEADLPAVHLGTELIIRDSA